MIKNTCFRFCFQTEQPAQCNDGFGRFPAEEPGQLQPEAHVPPVIMENVSIRAEVAALFQEAKELDNVALPCEEPVELSARLNKKIQSTGQDGNISPKITVDWEKMLTQSGTGRIRRHSCVNWKGRIRLTNSS